MKTTWVKIFLLTEGILLLMTVFELIQRVDLLLVILAGFLLIQSSKKQKRNTNAIYWVGWFMVGLSILSTFSFWLMLVVGMGYLILKGGSILEILQLDTLIDMPWKRKKYTGVQTKEPVHHAGKRRKQKWLGNVHIGEEVFEWDDINLSVFMGDSIIDLGNTLLPDEENVVLIRRGLGQTRVIVPMGVGVSLQHSVLQGNVIFQDQAFRMSNETIKLYSKNYDTATRKIKIVSNALLGDFEVIYL